MRASVLGLTLALGAGCGRCGGPDRTLDDRDAVLVRWLQRDNAVWQSREPGLLVGKYERMAADPYDFMRGTAGLFHEDLQRGSRPDAGTALLDVSRAARVLIVGDPHPENLSTFLAEDGPGPGPDEPAPDLTVAWADLDAATHGPWSVDVRRAALGLLLYAGELDGCGAGCQAEAVRALAEGYDQGVRASERGEPDRELEAALDGNAFVVDLLDEARREGAARARLVDATGSADGVRRFETVSRMPASGRGLLPLTGEERVRATRILAAYADQRGEPFRVLDVARRYGQGVSSWPASRFVVLWDTGLDGPQDDGLLNVREVLDPPAWADPGASGRAPWTSNGDRVVQTSRVLWPRPDLDPRLGAVDDGPDSFKLLSWTAWFQGLDHGRAGEVWSAGEADLDDLIALSRGIGGSLARAHCRGTTPSGAGACPAILQDLGPDPSALRTALPQLAFDDRDRTLRDHARFIRLLQRYGPLLAGDRSRRP